jgi:hypothetical protein
MTDIGKLLKNISKIILKQFLAMAYAKNAQINYMATKNGTKKRTKKETHNNSLQWILLAQNH